MKSLISPCAAGVFLLLAASACSQMPTFGPQHSAAVQKQVPQENAAAPQGGLQTNYASDGQDCNAVANKRMAMYDRPDTYPISDKERHDAYLSLYSSCMQGHNWQVAGPVHAPANNTSQFANLSPAAGGNRPAANVVSAGNTLVSTSSVPGATVVVIGGNRDTVSQLSSLSPSSGNATGQNATVVLVQSPQQNATIPQATYAYAPAQPLPVAVPLPPPVAKGYAPAPPRPTMSMPTQQSSAYRPSLAGAEGAASGTSAPPSPATAAQLSENQQLENMLEK